ncbi:MAG: TonB-dependent receptor plug domain-containing protein [Bacteroidia bacterium]
MRKIIITVTALFTLSLSAQQPLDSVKVSASRLAVKKFESGKDITLISQKEIAELPVTTVDELLQYVGGVNLNNRGGFGVQSDIGMRGSTFSQVLILVDNQRINDPLTSHFNSNIPIPLSEIHHIEIVRGSAAASFGADAVGGIIHVKTKTYEGLWEKDQSSTNGNLAFGEHNLTLADANYHQQGKHFGFSVGLKTNSSTGEQHVNPNFIGSQLGDSLYNNYFDLKTYTASLAYRKNGLKLYARAGVDSREFMAKYFYTGSKYDESEEEINSYWTQAAAVYQAKRSRTDFNISYRNNNDIFAFSPSSINEHTTDRVNATLSQTRKVKGYNLSYGFQSDYQNIVSTDRGDHETQTHAIFFLGHKRFNDLSLNGGIRVENSEKIGTQLVPQVNIAYTKNSKYILRSSIGRSIRQPDFTERFISYELPKSNLFPGRNIGNPDLEAESSYSFDIGMDAYLSNKLQFSNTIFARQSSNLIDYSLTNSSNIHNLTHLRDSTDYLYTMNISKSTTIGNELGLKYAILDKKNLKINANLNYTYIRTTTPDSVVSKYIANHPINNINGSVQLTSGGWNLNLGGAFITRNEEAVEAINAEIQSQYALVNARLSYTSQKMPVSVFVNVRNILDTQYQEILGARMPGRWMMAGISWSIK